jgi:peptidoglycan/LPS O-acetylase OafA/YrhL
MQATLSLTGQPTPAAAPVERTTPRLRLDVLDGIRGLAALYVALFHAMGYTGYTTTAQTQTTGFMRFVAAVLDFGTYAVPVFIVLSGFCLMLPLAQRGVTSIPGGVPTYIRRRAWRILPAYYMALFLSLALIGLVPALQTQQGTAWDTKVPVTIGAVISHLLLIHNALPDWIFKIDGPMWSIAIEWQIYFLFPTLLLPLLRRTNMLVTVLSAITLSLLPHFLLPRSYNLDFSHPWFLGLFTMGMAGAHVVFSNNPTVVTYRAKIPWRWANAALTLGLLSALMIARDWIGWHDYLFEPLVGLLVMGWLIQYASAIRQGGRRSLSQRILESRWLVGLGTCSYSIYLIHNPIQGLINQELLHVNMPANLRLALMVGVVTPLALLISYGFYVLVERRCMRWRERIAPAATSALRAAPGSAPSDRPPQQSGDKAIDILTHG